MNPCLHMYSLGFTAGGTLRALRETSPPTKTHAAPALLARRMTYSTPSTTISATVPTPAPAGSRQAAEPKSLCVTLETTLFLPTVNSRYLYMRSYS